jgi:hypothetical protein
MVQPGLTPTRAIPRAFLSYSWESDEHRAWIARFAERLRADGIDVTLDQWHLQPGDQMAAFMETAVRENDYVLIVCTPHYAKRSNERLGGVGYEGDIMTGEVLTDQNHRKFIPIFRAGNRWEDAAPTWLKGKYYIDLRGEPYAEERYTDLTNTLHRVRATPPPVVPRAAQRATPAEPNRVPEELPPFEPITILNVIVDEVTKPKMDGTAGSALYTVPFQLSRRPSAEWAEAFIHTWKHPPQWSTMHRPRIASVSGDRIYLNGTTMDEVADVHRETLKLCLQETNRIIAEWRAKNHAAALTKQRQEDEHQQRVRDAAKRITFD